MSTWTTVKLLNRSEPERSEVSTAELGQLLNIIPVTLIWVPGHAGVIQNEIADGLAKRGAI